VQFGWNPNQKHLPIGRAYKNAAFQTDISVSGDREIIGVQARPFYAARDLCRCSVLMAFRIFGGKPVIADRPNDKPAAKVCGRWKNVDAGKRRIFRSETWSFKSTTVQLAITHVEPHVTKAC